MMRVFTILFGLFLFGVGLWNLVEGFISGCFSSGYVGCWADDSWGFLLNVVKMLTLTSIGALLFILNIFTVPLTPVPVPERFRTYSSATWQPACPTCGRLIVLSSLAAWLWSVTQWLDEPILATITGLGLMLILSLVITWGQSLGMGCQVTHKGVSLDALFFPNFLPWQSVTSVILKTTNRKRLLILQGPGRRTTHLAMPNSREHQPEFLKTAQAVLYYSHQLTIPVYLPNNKRYDAWFASQQNSEEDYMNDRDVPDSD